MRPLDSVPERVEPVAIADHQTPDLALRREGEARSGPGMPVARLLEALQVVDMGARGSEAELPSVVEGKRNDVAGAEVGETPRGDLLVEVSGQRQGKLGYQRQNPAKPPRAGPVGGFGTTL